MEEKFEQMLPGEEKIVFHQALEALNKARVPYTIGGAFAVYWYSGVWRNTKDIDVFVTPNHRGETMNALSDAGFLTFVKDERWLAKAVKGPYLVDIVYGMGDWIAPVDEIWIKNARQGVFLGLPVTFAPVEETIWVKSFIAAHDRFDGADINHLINAVQGNLNWQHLLERFDEHWEVLLAQLTLFRYVFPSNREYIPKWVMDELLRRFNKSLNTPWLNGRLCRGPLLDITSMYETDIKEHGYEDARKEVWRRRKKLFPESKAS